ncbi:MAG: polysaccharide lyase family protein [Tepidisphaeraceae bacterium]|jgi:autotransporter-associated beta strand protein
MSNLFRGGRKSRTQEALFAAVSAALGTACSVGHAQVTLTQNSSTNWTMTNGALTVVFDPSGQEITSIKLGVGGGASPNLLNTGGTSSTNRGTLDQEFAGTPFGSGPQTFESQLGPNNSYVDVWTNVASTGTTVNPITYAFHYVLFANDPTIYCYEALSHSATDPATSVGQGQFLFRSNPSLFPNLYQINTGPNQLGMANAQTTIGVPSTNSNYGTVAAQAGRGVQDATHDLTGSGIAGDNGTNFFTKYDYSTYTQFYQAETMYGTNYAVSEVDPSTDTLTGGPTKQELAWTDPGILNMEFLSDHYGIDGTGSGAYPGYGYYPTQGVATSKLFGPYGFTISSTSGTTGAQINQNAINAIPNDQAEFATDSELIASGYVPNSSRGSVQIQAANSAGWSANTANNTVVLSEPRVNVQESTQGYQYCGQLSQTGAVTISNVVPGTYRMSLYQLGQWGETRVDGVQVQNGQVTIPQNVKFTPENFGTAAPIWTIGTPNRSANEFMNGHNASGADQRQYKGAYDFWAEEAALGTPGYVSYNATATTIGGVAQPATNNPNAWIANQWYTFNPGLYDSANSSTDNYTKTCPAYVTAGGGPANYHGSAWQVHFEVTSAQEAQGQYVVLSVGLVSQMASLVVTLNGHSETWSFGNFSPDDPMVRSGDAGFYQWAAFQFPTSDLNAVGTDNEFTFGVSAHTDGVMYDALRMEITNTSANPSVTGWYDYNYINSSTQVAQNDTINTLAWNNTGAPAPADGQTWDTNNNNWSNSVVGTYFATGDNVIFNDSNNGHYTVTLNTTVSPNSVLVNNSSGNYVISGTGSIAGSGGLAKYGSGTLTLDTVNTYTGGTVVNAGTLVVGVNGALPNAGVSITGGTLQLGTGTGLAKMTSLSITGTGVLDVNNDHIIVTYGASDPFSTIAGYIKSGYNGGGWNGAGIISSAALTPTNGLVYGLGYADGKDGIVSGLSSGQIEVKYTLLGDANLDGLVNAADFTILAANFNQPVTGWDQGDFNYDGLVNAADFTGLAANFNQGVSGAASAGDVAALDAFAAANAVSLANVPEPASALMMAMAGLGILRRRRRPSPRFDPE